MVGRAGAVLAAIGGGREAMPPGCRMLGTELAGCGDC